MVARSRFPICRRDRSRLPSLPSDRLRWKTMRWPSGWYSAATFFRSANSSFTNSSGRRRRNRDGSPISAASLVSRAHSPCGSGTGAAWTIGGRKKRKATTRVPLLVAELIFVDQGPGLEAVPADFVQKARRLGEDHARGLVVDVHWTAHVEVLLRAGDGDVEEAALLLQLDVEHALIGRLQRQVRQERFQLAVARGDRVEVLHVLDALGIVVVVLLEDRQVIPADGVHLLGRGHPPAAHFFQDADQLLEALRAGA